MAENNHLIVIRSLYKTFGYRVVLKDLNLEIEDGDFVAIFGPNGAGKTTLLKILSTLSSPTSGEIYINGVNPEKDRNKIRANLGVLTHESYLYENLTALENLKFFASMYDLNDIHNKSIEVLRYVGLEDRGGYIVRNFSRGMKQRLSLARAIIHNPSILLLDEPYTGLDQHGIKILNELIIKLVNEKKTIVMTTHNFYESLSLAKTSLILNQGRIVYEERNQNQNSEEFMKKYISVIEEKL